MSAHPIRVDELEHARLLLDLVAPSERGVLVDRPVQWLVRKGEVSKDLLVEAVLAQQQLLDPPEKSAGLRSLDDPVVVRGREGGDFADRELRESLGCHRRE